MGDLPHVPVRVGERAGVAAPVGVSGRTGDGTAGALGLRENGVDLVRRAHVVGKLDAWRRVPTQGRPQAEDHSARLEERDLVVRLHGAAPPHRLIEGTRAGEVCDAKSHQADPLLHGGPSMSAP